MKGTNARHVVTVTLVLGKMSAMSDLLYWITLLSWFLLYL